MEHTPERYRFAAAPRPRRRPQSDRNRHGQEPDRQRRQFLNYSFYRLDPVFRRLPADEQRVAATGFIELVEDVGVFGQSDASPPRIHSWACARMSTSCSGGIAFDPLCFQSMEAAIRRSRLGAYLSQVYTYLSLQRRSPYIQQDEGRRGGRCRAAAGRGEVPVRVPLHQNAVVWAGVAARPGKG